MAIQVRNVFPLIASNIVDLFNSLKREVAEGASFPHVDITSTSSGAYESVIQVPLQISLDTATDLPTAMAVANKAKSVINTHFTDVHAHKTASTLLSSPDATDLASLCTLNDEMAAALLAHAGDETAHVYADGTLETAMGGYVASTDLQTAIDGVTLIQVHTNLHITRAFTTPSIILIDP